MTEMPVILEPTPEPTPEPEPLPATGPLFQNSVVSTDIDFIRATDADAFSALTHSGQDSREMPDKRGGGLIDRNTFVFDATFTDSTSVGIWVHSDFGNFQSAQEVANKATGPLGKLPSFMRNTLRHVVVHRGNESAFGESDGNFFVLYSQNMDTRISNNDLEETVFHESVHATLDAQYLSSRNWQDAQRFDNRFITEYARSRPNKEDMAESALFAYTMIRHPGRLSPEIESWVRTNIPNRFAFFQGIFASR